MRVTTMYHHQPFQVLSCQGVSFHPPRFELLISQLSSSVHSEYTTPHILIMVMIVECLLQPVRCSRACVTLNLDPERSEADDTLHTDTDVLCPTEADVPCTCTVTIVTRPNPANYQKEAQMSSRIDCATSTVD